MEIFCEVDVCCDVNKFMDNFNSILWKCDYLSCLWFMWFCLKV